MDYKLSPSSINLMLECPLCFWLQIVKKIKRPDTPFPSLPSGMDRVLKSHFDRFMGESKLPPDLDALQEADDYRLFDDTEKLAQWRNNFKGIQYLDENSGVLLRGAIDNLLVKGKKLVVLDYKTRGYPVKEDTHEHYRTQMDLYNFLLRKNGYETEDYAYLLFYYPETLTGSGEVIFNKELIKMQTDPERGEKSFNEAIRILGLKDPPDSGPSCGFCKFKQGKIK